MAGEGKHLRRAGIGEGNRETANPANRSGIGAAGPRSAATGEGGALAGPHRAAGVLVDIEHAPGGRGVDGWVEWWLVCAMIARTIRMMSMMAAAAGAAAAAGDPWLVFPGGEGPGKGKHVVLVSGDEEYRSEEALPMLGRLLADRLGFKCTVLFAIDRKTGEINPNEGANIPGLEAVGSADLLLVALRFRQLPDEQMKWLVDHIDGGKPLLALRTSTHAFRYPKDSTSPYAKWSFDSAAWPGGFGKQVLGETWVNHHGHHGKESTRGVPEPAHASHPLLRGVDDVWGPSDVYTVRELPTDATVLLRGRVLTGMQPEDPPAAGAKNDPMMPVAWVRARPLDGGRTQRVICTTMGAATDFVRPGLRRFVANTALWACGLEVPAQLNVEPAGAFEPTAFGFNAFRKGLRPADFAR